MRWESGFEYSQEMRPWISPSLIEANYILSLSQQDLEQVIEAEMAGNPALEVEDRQTCPTCGSVLEGTYCLTCLTDQRAQQVSESLDSYEDYAEQPVTTVSSREDESDFDPMSLVASEFSVLDQILADVRAMLDEREFPIAEYLVESLDERGFLPMDVEEICSLTGLDEDEIREVLEVIQEVAPIGVGARNLKECLLLQAAYLRTMGIVVPECVFNIIETHLTEFGTHKYGQIERDLGISASEIDDAREFIREHLNPFPLQSDQGRSWRSPTDSAYVAPDVVIMLKNDDLIVEVVDSKYFHLRTNAVYEQLSGQFSRRKTAPQKALVVVPEFQVAPSDVSAGDKDHVRQYTNRAKLFISNIQQRRDTLLRISQCICELQDGFLRGGVRELRPLTRAVVAQQVGVHESTVSRATASKFVMLPNRKVIPFADFFTPSLSTKDIIKELIVEETRKGTPLTDRKICDLLLDRGVRIARRTVAKYRAELGILPSTMR
ncbi:MAG: RNA polymerase factor sigma-54, partial [Thermomicrobiales bacterium]